METKKNTGGFLNREALLSKRDVVIAKVEFEDGTFVYVREFTGEARDRFEESIMKKVADEKGKLKFTQTFDNYRAKLAVQTLCDEKGELLFRPTDYLELSKNITSKMLEKIVKKAQEINKMSEDEMEDMEKN